MGDLRVALLQVLPEKSLEGGLEKGLRCCRRAKGLGADIAVFPEMWSTGYRIPEELEELRELLREGTL